MTEQTNTPDLRFPEFKDKWQGMNLSNIVTTIKGNDNQIDLPILTISAKYGWLTQKERFSQVIAGNSLKKYTKVSKGDLSYNKGNSKVAKYGIVYKMDYDEALVPNVYKSFRPHKGIDSIFIEKYFHTKKLDRQLRKYISSTARMDGLLNINDNDFYKLNIYMPSSVEQEKIGIFFSKLDRQIELEEQKLEKLEEQKKGYMQKIFSQELRFKDESGKDYPEWEIKKLRELYKVVMGQSPKSINYTDDNSYPVLVQGNADIYNGNIFPRIYTKEITKLVKKGDILLTVRAPVGEIGIAQFEACMGRGVCSIEGDKFIYYFLEMFGIQNKWQKLSQGSTFESISGNEVKNIEMPIPSRREREKVSDFFSELDHIINMHSQKIDNMKLRKQGLLQKMFI